LSHSELARCRAWIEAALHEGGDVHGFDDIAAMIRDGRVQFWPAPEGCLVTEILVYPRAKVLNVFLGGGKLDQLLDMQGSVVAFARAMGCTKMTIQGRKGWVRALAHMGWVHTHSVVMKEI
jgi:hypothetical protein